MSSVVIPAAETASLAPAAMSRKKLLKAYVIDAKYEFLRVMRQPAFVVPLLGLPVALYWFIGVLLMSSIKLPPDSVLTRADMLNSAFGNFTVFGIMGPAISSFGIIVAVERDMNLLTFRRACPMPAPVYLISKLLMSFLCAIAAVSAMTLLSIFSHATSLTPTQYLGVFSIGVLGVLPFGAIGFALGTALSTQVAGLLTNMLFIATSIFGGLFFALPPSVGWLMFLSPAFYLSQLDAYVLGQPTVFPPAIPVAVLFFITGGLSWFGIQRFSRSAS